MSSPTLFVDLSQVNGHAVVRLIGELDLPNVDHAKTQAIRALTTSPNGPLLIDLSELSFCGSAGLRALHQLQQEAQRRGREMVLLRPQGIVRRVIEIAGMEPSFVIDDSDARGIE